MLSLVQTAERSRGESDSDAVCSYAAFKIMIRLQKDFVHIMADSILTSLWLQSQCFKVSTIFRRIRQHNRPNSI